MNEEKGKYSDTCRQMITTEVRDLPMIVRSTKEQNMAYQMLFR